MNKRIVSFFTFGLFLIIIGAIGRFLQWQQAMTLIAIGLIFETLALILFAWSKIKKNE